RQPSLATSALYGNSRGRSTRLAEGNLPLRLLGSVSGQADLHELGAIFDRRNVVTAEGDRDDGGFAATQHRRAGIDDDRAAEHVHGARTVDGRPGDPTAGGRAKVHGGEGRASDRAYGIGTDGLGGDDEARGISAPPVERGDRALHVERSQRNAP